MMRPDPSARVGFVRRLRRNACRGFTLIESLIGIAILGVALISLAEVFLLGVKNNKSAGDIGSAAFLAQQQIDQLRALTAEELSTFPSSDRGEADDETLDPNGDAVPDFRRITEVQAQGLIYGIKVFVFSANRIGASRSALVRKPWENGVRALLRTTVSR